MRSAPASATVEQAAPLGRGAAAESAAPKVRIACLTGRSILGQGVLAILESSSQLDVSDRPDHADVTVVLADTDDAGLAKAFEPTSDPNRTVAVGSLNAAIDLLQGGVAGIVTTSVSPEELQSVVLQVAAGRRAFSADVADLLVRQLARPTVARDDLTPNQRLVLERLALGDNIGQIAERLNVSHQAISQTLERLRHRLQVSTNRDLAKYARRLGLVP